MARKFSLRNNVVIKQLLAKLFETEKIKTRDALRMCGIFFHPYCGIIFVVLLFTASELCAPSNQCLLFL